MSPDRTIPSSRSLRPPDMTAPTSWGRRADVRPVCPPTNHMHLTQSTGADRCPSTPSSSDDLMHDLDKFKTYSKKSALAGAGHTLKAHVYYGPVETIEGPTVDGVAVVEFPHGRRPCVVRQPGLPRGQGAPAAGRGLDLLLQRSRPSRRHQTVGLCRRDEVPW